MMQFVWMRGSLLGVMLGESAKLCRLVFASFWNMSIANQSQPLYQIPYQRIHFKSDTMAHVALAYEGSSWTSEYAYPLMLLQTLIGSFDRAAGRPVTSQLCHDVAANNLANSISTFNTCYKDTGLFGLYAIAERETVGDLMTCVTNNLAKLVDTIQEEDVERGKIALKATMLMGLDGFVRILEGSY